MSSVVLYFGSFNPIHTAHIAIAKHMTELADEVWFVVSPHNPHKESSLLAFENHRLKMVNDALLSTNMSEKIKVCTIEFSLPRPSFTYNTLRELRKSHPETTFSIVMGSDNLQNIERWKNAEEILEQTPIYVYPREGYQINKLNFSPYRITYLDNVEKMAISSTEIRSQLNTNSDILPITKEYIIQNNLYK